MGLTSYDLNVRFVQGNTPALNFTIYDDSGNLFNTATITAVTWAVQGGCNPGGPILLQKTLADGITFPQLGVCQVPIIARDTLIPPLLGSNVHQLVLTDNTGNVLTVTGADDAVGKFIVDPRIAVAS